MLAKSFMEKCMPMPTAAMIVAHCGHLSDGLLTTVKTEYISERGRSGVQLIVEGCLEQE